MNPQIQQLETIQQELEAEARELPTLHFSDRTMLAIRQGLRMRIWMLTKGIEAVEKLLLQAI